MNGGIRRRRIETLQGWVDAYPGRSMLSSRGHTPRQSPKPVAYVRDFTYVLSHVPDKLQVVEDGSSRLLGWRAD